MLPKLRLSLDPEVIGCHRLGSAERERPAAPILPPLPAKYLTDGYVSDMNITLAASCELYWFLTGGTGVTGLSMKSRSQGTETPSFSIASDPKTLVCPVISIKASHSSAQACVRNGSVTFPEAPDAVPRRPKVRHLPKGTLKSDC